MQQVAVITGGSAGIGRATARVLVDRGYAVGLIARGAERLEQARLELEQKGGSVHVVVADVADPEAVEAAATEIETALGPITLWINNAMATVYSPISKMDAGELKRVTEVTYLGAVNGTLTALKHMQGGTIVQVSSVLAWRAIPVQGAYCGAKFALRGFTESLRAELIHDKSPLHLTMVHLPAINTPQFDWARNKTGQKPIAPSPYQPEVAADAIVYAATHKRRDVFVGSSTPPTILAARLAPTLVDQLLARKGYSSQLSALPVPPNEGNLFEPAPGTSQAARGSFDAQAKDRRDIYTSRQGDIVAASLVLVGAISLQMLATSPLVAGPMIMARVARGALRRASR